MSGARLCGRYRSARSLDCLLGHPNISDAASTGKLDLFYVDIDADNSGGGKPDEGHKGGPQRRRFAYPDVSDAIRHHPNPHVIDAVLVDGRFRAACVLKAASVVRDDTPIMIHDAYREDCKRCLAWPHFVRPPRSFFVLFADQYPITAGGVRIIEQVGSLRVLLRTPFAAELDSRPDTLAAWAAVWAPVEFDFSRR